MSVSLRANACRESIPLQNGDEIPVTRRTPGRDQKDRACVCCSRSLPEVLSDSQDYRRVLFTLLLLVPLFGMHTPIAGESITLLASIVVIAVEWKHIQVEAELKRILALFVTYLIVFSLLSDDHARSLKGSYDILRGLVFFPIGLLLARYARSKDVSILLAVSVTGLILAQFLYQRDGFFGFYINPNNVAVTLVFLLSLSLISSRWSAKDAAIFVIRGLGIVAALYLLVLTHSRAAWLGCAVGAGTLLLIMRALSAPARMVLLALVAAALAGALFFLNTEGLKLNLRDVIWGGLLKETLRSSPWIGYGINYTKELLPAINVPFQTSHNLFLEFFVSSGVVGLAFMLYLFYRLAKHYAGFRFDRAWLFHAGVFGLIAFLVMDQFDLKFASYRFFGSHCFFLGLIYAHRQRRAAEGVSAADPVAS